MTNPQKNYQLEKFGFSFGRGSVHNSRTLMLSELQTLFSHVPQIDAKKNKYLEAIRTDNCLGKRSDRTRLLTYRHLIDLYSLNSELALFRALRFFWQRDIDGQPLLAALIAYSRDPILRSSVPFVLDFPEGSTVSRVALEEHIDTIEPGRFSKATLKSTAQNINSSLTQTGHLSGRAKKIRERAKATISTVSLALFIGYLCGLRGDSLFNSEYTRLLDCSFDKTLELAEDASRRSWISLKRVGNVIEVLFPNFINTEEMELLREQN